MKQIALFVCATGLMHAASEQTVTIEYLKNHPKLLPAVVELWWQGQGALQSTHATKPTEGMTKRLKEHMNDDTLPLCLIALKDDEVVGMIRLTDIWTTDPAVAPKIATHPEWGPWLCGLGVAKAHRKQGIASKLIIAAEAKAAELGHDELYLGAGGDADMKAFYERRGYEAFEQDTFRGQAETLMKHKLTK